MLENPKNKDLEGGVSQYSDIILIYLDTCVKLHPHSTPELLQLKSQQTPVIISAFYILLFYPESYKRRDPFKKSSWEKESGAFEEGPGENKTGL